MPPPLGEGEETLSGSPWGAGAVAGCLTSAGSHAAPDPRRKPRCALRVSPAEQNRGSRGSTAHRRRPLPHTCQPQVTRGPRPAPLCVLGKAVRSPVTPNRNGREAVRAGESAGSPGGRPVRGQRSTPRKGPAVPGAEETEERRGARRARVGGRSHAPGVSVLGRGVAPPPRTCRSSTSTPGPRAWSASHPLGISDLKGTPPAVRGPGRWQGDFGAPSWHGRWSKANLKEQRGGGVGGAERGQSPWHET